MIPHRFLNPITAMPPSEQILSTTCRLCYNSCGMLVTCRDGRPVAVDGDPTHPISHGVLCAKGQAALDVLTHPQRLRWPLVRCGDRGGGRWRAVDWPEALERVAQGLLAVRRDYGPLALVMVRGASKGLSDALLSRFANLVGTPNITSPAPVCFVPGVKASELTYGSYLYPDFEGRPRCILVWGANPRATTLPVYHQIVNARRKGARLIVVDPLDSDLACTADVWLRPRPDSDAALVMAMLHVLVAERRFDAPFVERWCVGFRRLVEHAARFSPDRIRHETWVAPEDVRRAARLYAANRPGVVVWGNGIETGVNSFSACRAIAVLRAVSGNIGVPGGEVFRNAPGGIRPNYPELSCRELIPAQVRARRLSAADGILPDLYYALPQTIVSAILDRRPYAVRAAYVQASNPLTAWPEGERTYRALRQLDFLAVSDLFMTPTAMLADVVLPAASFLEYDSIEQPWHLPVVCLQQKTANIGQCRSDGEILNGLLRAMGLGKSAFADVRQPLDRVLATTGITFDEFRRIGTLVGRPVYRHFRADGFATPSGKVELFSERLQRWGFDPLPTPASIVDEKRDGQNLPLVLTSRKDEVYRHSLGRQIVALRRQAARPQVRVHPDTARRYGLTAGCAVRVVTAHGAIVQQLTIDDRLDPRLVEVSYAWWFPEADSATLFDWRRANLNMLTSARASRNPEMGGARLRGEACRLEKEQRQP